MASDNNNNKIVTHGSGNATGAAINSNADSFTVERSWIEKEIQDLNEWEKKINNYFNNKAKNTIVMNFSDASKQKLISITQSLIGIKGGKGTTPPPENPCIPTAYNGKKFKLKITRGSIEFMARFKMSEYPYNGYGLERQPSIYGVVKLYEQ